MRRRLETKCRTAFGVMLAFAAALGPAASLAQSSKVIRIGIVMSEPSKPLDSMRDELHRLGYVDGRNARYEYRFARGVEQRYPELAAELSALPVDVIVTWGTPASFAAKRATGDIPIVMAAIGDPVSTGIVASLSHPGGNVTGFSTVNAELEDKRLEILKELLPSLRTVGVLSNANSSYAGIAVERLRSSGQAKGLKIAVESVRNKDDIAPRLAALAEAKPDAVVVVADSFLTSHHNQITGFMAAKRLPAIYAYEEAVEVGGLLAYATDYHELFRRAAAYVDRIVKGAKPGELPIQQATNFQLTVNAQTARELGLAVPEPLLLQAARVIE
jgi:putative tryptophan/tyrosine transport system substrate-binding protein